MNRTVKIFVSLAFVAAAIAGLVYSSLGEAELFKHVDEVLAKPTRYEGTTLRIHGFVEAGSISEEIRDQNVFRTFILEYEGQRIRVHHSGPKPDTFRDESEVTARGELVKRDGEYQLDAEDLTAKCPSKYEGNRRPRQARAE